MHSFRIIIRRGCKGAVLARGALHGARVAPRLMRHATHRWRLIEDAPFTLALAALLLPVAAPQAVEEGFPQQHSAAHSLCDTLSVDRTHTRTRATRTAVGESESDHGSRGSDRLRTNS